jgi:hypothetical protein
MGYGGFRPGGATTSKERQVARSPARSCGRMCSASHAGKPHDGALTRQKKRGGGRGSAGPNQEQ